jgi:hypothetical protein
MIDDAAKLVNFAADCPILAATMMGIIIVGKLTPAQGNYIFAIVAMEYFTKWVEAKLVTNITFATIQKFFWQNIIYRYGVPQQITIHNAKYFDTAMFNYFCHRIGTKVSFASVYHPSPTEKLSEPTT